MLSAEGECRTGLSIGPICSSMQRVSANSSASGIWSQAKRGAPMSTVETSGAAPFQVFSSPAGVSKVSASLPVSLKRSSAMQRVPLPQAPASEPSLL